MNIVDLIHKFFEVSDSYDDEIIIRCPFCDESKGHCYVNIKKRVYHCWICEETGNLRKLFSKRNISIKGLKYEHQSNKEEEPSEEITLPDGFSLIGNNNDDEDNIVRMARAYLQGRGISTWLMKRHKIGVCNNNEKLFGFIIFPCYDISNKLNYWVGRSFIPGTLRYKNPRTPRREVIWGINIWLKGDRNILVICEGIFDAIKDLSCVAILSSKLTKDQISIIKLVEPKEIIIALDYGEKEKLKSMCLDIYKSDIVGNNIKVVQFNNSCKKDFGEMNKDEIDISIKTSKIWTTCI